MGCDIHLYKEKYVNGVWLTADEWEWYGDEGEGTPYVPFNKTFNHRNYALFGTIAKGVRKDMSVAIPCRGIPLDASKEVEVVAKEWDDDAHSHSYLYLEDIVSLQEKLQGTEQGDMVGDALESIVNLFQGVDGDNHRIVFFFDS